MKETLEQSFGPVTFIPGDNRGRYPFCHSLFIEGEKRVVIDPASNQERLRSLRDGAGVDMVWLSHYHEDHLAYLGLFEDSELWISEADAPALADIEVFLDFYGIEKAEERTMWKEFMESYFNFTPRRADRLFREKEVIDLGGVTAEVLPTPGHTKGHMAFYFPEPEVLFLGDYDLSRFGPWYGDRDSSIEDTIASVNLLRKIPARYFIVPHEEGVFETDPGELWDEYLAVISQRERKLLELLSKPRSMAEIIDARIVYKKAREPKMFYDFAEQVLMQKHLEQLIGEGRVKQEGETFVLI
jgi:glyoxylase-like metal-dependent hydrolase (beta-lactamase superfamily II)